MNKINNIFKDININNYPTQSIIESDYINNIANNSIMISELDSYENSYLLYYKSDNQSYQLSYIIREGNGLYNYDTYHSLFFNIDDNSIQESYNKIFVNTNFISTSNDNSYNYGISYIDNTYLSHKINSITLNNDIISYFYLIKNKINDLYDKYKNIYKQISYYNNVSLTYNYKQNSTIIYDYKDVNIKYIDNYYFGNGILDIKYKDDYITLPPNSNTIYYKNINLLNILLEVKSDYREKNNNIIDDNNYEIPTDTNIFAILTKSNEKKSQFAVLNSNYTQKTDIDNHLNTTFNNIYLENNTNNEYKLFKKYGGNISISIIPNNLSYTYNQYINYNVNYDAITLYNNIENNYILEDNYVLSRTSTKFKTITKFIPTKDNIKICFDNRNIEKGISCKDNTILNTYLCLLNKQQTNIIINNKDIVDKLIEKNIIWYNYDNIIHYGYNYSYINDNIYTDNIYSYSYSYYIKNYSPIFQNISTKIINFDFLRKYNSNSLSNLETIDIDNILTFDMNSFIYSKDKLENDIYLYSVENINNEYQFKYKTTITI